MANFDISTINTRLEENAEAFIAECENAYRSQLDAVVGEISLERGRVLVMLAGPSSSGKTTTARLIADKLSALGRNAVVISLDDFYLEQDIPRTFEDGTVDYETVEALDVPLISECLHRLLNTGECPMPHFCFKTKKRGFGKKLTVDAQGVVIVEGLHALNPAITALLCDETMKKYYVSVSSRITDGEEVLLSKRDLRFVRRMIRDFYHRNSDVEYTCYLWKGVRMGEDRYLFPYSGLADRKIDSIHPYETALFKQTAISLLDRVDKNSEYYENINELKQKLERFRNVDIKQLPADSLLNEFIG